VKIRRVVGLRDIASLAIVFTTNTILGERVLGRELAKTVKAIEARQCR